MDEIEIMDRIGEMVERGMFVLESDTPKDEFRRLYAKLIYDLVGLTQECYG